MSEEDSIRVKRQFEIPTGFDPSMIPPEPKEKKGLIGSVVDTLSSLAKSLADAMGIQGTRAKDQSVKLGISIKSKLDPLSIKMTQLFGEAVSNITQLSGKNREGEINQTAREALSPGDLSTEEQVSASLGAAAPFSLASLSPLLVDTNASMESIGEFADDLRSEKEVQATQLRSNAPIEKEFVVNGNSVGVERITRYDVISDARNKIIQRMGFAEENSVEFEVLASQLENLDNVQNKTWLNSNYFRNEVKIHGFDEAYNRFLGLPINMRYQELADNARVENSGFLRLGMMTDPRNGFTNLKELKALAGNNEARLAKIEQLKAFPAVNDNQRASIARAINQLENIDRTILERRTILEGYFLETLNAQVEKKGIKGEEFVLTHLSLLNQKKSALDSTGWMHNEGNSIEDMAEIFKEMRGKEIIFGQGGPAVKGHRIFLPQISDQQQVRLIPIFMNVSVQGNLSNTGLQAAVNQDNFEYLRDIVPEDSPELANLKILLAEESSSYVLAEQVGIQLRNLGALSVCCASAKDRTGFISARLIQRKLAPFIPNDMAKKFEREVLAADSPAARVVCENTGINVLKVDPRVVNSLPGLSSQSKVRFIYAQGAQMAGMYKPQAVTE